MSDDVAPHIAQTREVAAQGLPGVEVDPSYVAVIPGRNGTIQGESA